VPYCLTSFIYIIHFDLIGYSQVK